MSTHDSRTDQMLERIQSGDEAALEDLFAEHRDYLRVVLELRMDRHLSARLDASDVIQEAHIAALNRMDDYLARRPMPFRLWLRNTACECLSQLRRKHIETKGRSVKQEVPLPDRSSLLLAGAAGCPTPSENAAEEELAGRVRQAVAELPEKDYEILLMRNFEELTNQEAAQALQIKPDTARRRYTRALLRLRIILEQSGLSESKI